MTRPANTNLSPGGDLILGQRRRRWPNIKSTSGRMLGTSKNKTEEDKLR